MIPLAWISLPPYKYIYWWERIVKKLKRLHKSVYHEHEVLKLTRSTFVTVRFCFKASAIFSAPLDTYTRTEERQCTLVELQRYLYRWEKYLELWVRTQNTQKAETQVLLDVHAQYESYTRGVKAYKWCIVDRLSTDRQRVTQLDPKAFQDSKI